MHGMVGIQIRDTKQKNPRAQCGEKKLINVSVPLFIKQELTHKYSQNSKVRSGDSSVNAQQLRTAPSSRTFAWLCLPVGQDWSRGAAELQVEDSPVHAPRCP